ncbi:MAG: hypothetical protein LAO21_20235 [Acidobacteriia bacterium]|nr:hypothetical protein [Terriglobia bacterium]
MYSFDSFPDFENFRYQIANVPSGSKLQAWIKLRECERRLAFCIWAKSFCDFRDPKITLIFQDAISAFLQSYESTIQILYRQLTPGKLKLPQPLQDDVIVGGLRTLRDLETHVEGRLEQEIEVNIGDSIQGHSSGTKISYTVKLRSLEKSDLPRNKNARKLRETGLSNWNNLDRDPARLFEHGLQELKKALIAVENQTYPLPSEKMK